MYSLKNSSVIALLLLLFVACHSTYDGPSQVVYLDSLAFKEIINPYGPPLRKKAFGHYPLTIAGKSFERGIGTHAPMTVHIDLNGEALRFDAIVGLGDSALLHHKQAMRDSMDTHKKHIADYVYDNSVDHYKFDEGSTVIFVVLADDQELFNSGVMHLGDSAQEVSVDISGAEKLTLMALDAADGSYIDYANWANARLTVKADTKETFALYHYPEAMLVNHAGFMTGSPKHCHRHGTETADFQLIEADSKKVVYEGKMQAQGKDFGQYLRGDFSDFNKPGRYIVQSGDYHSQVFLIHDTLYNNCLSKHLQYIYLQCSGHPQWGWRPGQHIDDGVRQDNNVHQDVVGGYYDACDIRKPTEGTAYLLLALTEVAQNPHNGQSAEALYPLIRWGNQFLLKMQEPQGYIMHYIGSTWEGFSDNRWTDNKIGTKDDRTIITRPASNTTHLQFIIDQTNIYQLYKNEHPEYADTCIKSALRCYNWTLKQDNQLYNDGLAMGIMAACGMYQIKPEQRFQKDAEMFIDSFFTRQIRDEASATLRFENKGRRGIIQSAGWVMAGLARFLETFPESKQAETCKKMLTEYVDTYVLPISHRNTFAMLPFLIGKEDMNTGKQIGNLFYKHLLHVGVNNRLGADGYGLIQAAKVLNRPELIAIAQQQLNWIYGANPHNASTVHEIGYNQPTLFKTSASEYKPYTPELTGGVMTGLGANPQDKPCTYPGWWWTTEYWSPSVANTIRLINALMAEHGR